MDFRRLKNVFWGGFGLLGEVGLLAVVVWSCVGVAATTANAAEGDLLDVRDSADAPVKMIFDTDIGGDIDDAFALGLIHRLADRGAVELLGVTLTNANEPAGRFVAALNAKYGRPGVPVGVASKSTKVFDEYPSKTLAQKTADGAAEYPVPDGFKLEESVSLLRRLLAEAEDGSVVIVQVGYASNLAALLETPGDDVSPLTGRELAAKKVRLVSLMAGAFSFDDSTAAYRDHKEWNVICDIPAMQKFAADWPTPAVFSGYETGDRVRMSPVNLKNDYRRSPTSKILYDAFGHWTARNTKEGYDHRRPTWDLTSVLFVARPESGRGYFALSEAGEVDVRDDGLTTFKPDPNGRRRVFILDEAARIRVEEAFVNLCSEP